MSTGCILFISGVRGERLWISKWINPLNLGYFNNWVVYQGFKKIAEIVAVKYRQKYNVVSYLSRIAFNGSVIFYEFLYYGISCFSGTWFPPRLTIFD